MFRLIAIAGILAVLWLHLGQTNPRLLRQLHLPAPPAGASLNPVMGGAASGVGAAAVGLAGRAGG